MKDKKILNNETMKELTNETDEKYNKRLKKMKNKICKDCKTEIREFKDYYNNIWVGCLNCDDKDYLKEIKENER